MTDVDSTWSQQQRELWQRLAAHDFGTSDCALTFARRLAREHGWSEAYADGAIREYKRFCFLAAVAGHPVSPSDAVDEVWHQHLTYSRDYWQRFCPDVLAMTLHHEPTRGGRDQAKRHYDQYAETLASYQRWFGPPAVDYWPDAQNYTASPARYRRVDLARSWLLPRTSLRGLDWRRAAVAAVLLPVAPLLQALPLNPLDFDGPSFLLLFLVLAVVAGVAAAVVRRNFGPPARPGAALDTWSTAYLAGGPQRVVDAGIASLIADGKAQWNRKQRRLDIAHPDTVRDYPLDEIARAARAGNGAVPQIVRSVGSKLGRIREPLVARGLLIDNGQRWLLGLYRALPFAALTAFGTMKIAVGLARDRPVAFLIFLTLVTGIATLLLFTVRPQRSRAGDLLLRDLNRSNAHARRAPRNHDIGLAVALAGTGVLAGTAYADFHNFRQASSSTSSSGCSSSDSGCSSDSGGSSGCGGCGGGD
ncbi:MAG TPA: TIGR04222 domain-containing membrane protein [Tahibacter sp.]|uniref:TIGR04222 domain-containing membrane protein n=1 Tax=Tahibacter sp. TaxID=2056211 RepID=UPI002BF04D46|nr:TIGR04222 domain-containing membrane protein [Tahibacter sp.]HSX61182.1 TIGR04222 domain-containing membrane protein [Tahibacter sp.]